MSLQAKICGLRKQIEVETAIKYGASFCGFILNWPKSHRYIDIDKAKSLTNINKSNSNFVGVLVDPNDGEVELFNSLNLQYFQLHGDEDVKRVKEIKNFTKKKIIKTIKIRTKKDLDVCKSYENIADILLFDSASFEKSEAFDHSLLKKLDKKENKWMIAGNIKTQDLENISKIADYVDVSGSLEKNKRNELTEHVISHRPWGYFENINSNETHKIKKLTVMPGKKLSLQSHNKRSEHWVVISGVASVTKGDTEFTLHKDESTFIPAKVKHRLTNKSKSLLVIIEVQTGQYFGEDDIKRFDDIYGRIN